MVPRFQASGHQVTELPTATQRSLPLVVHVSPTYFSPESYIGGGERFVEKLSRAMAEQVRDTLDDRARARLDLPPLSDAILNVHRLGTARPDARRRLAFDEALLLQLALETPRFQASRERGIAHVITHQASARLAQQSDDALDDTRSSALEDIKRDLRRSIPMQRST